MDITYKQYKKLRKIVVSVIKLNPKIDNYKAVNIAWQIFLGR